MYVLTGLFFLCTIDVAGCLQTQPRRVRRLRCVCPPGTCVFLSGPPSQANSVALVMWCMQTCCTFARKPSESCCPIYFRGFDLLRRQARAPNVYRKPESIVIDRTPEETRGQRAASRLWRICIWLCRGDGGGTVTTKCGGWKDE